MRRKTKRGHSPTKWFSRDITEELIGRIHQLPDDVSSLYLKEVLTSKFVSSETDPPDVRRQRAINKWLATEANNAATNDRLMHFPGEYQVLPRVSYSSFVATVQAYVSDILGDVPPFEALIGTFSGGASTSRRRTSSHPAGKYLGEAHSTPRAFELFLELAPEMAGWLLHGDLPDPVMVEGNSMFTVPKNTLIDRVACKEPDINMFMQKGLGSEIRKCLRRKGIDLNDQSINRNLARQGSVDGSLATLDLSSASDSVSYGLVAMLLPTAWFTLLDSTRCAFTCIDGDWHKNEMFSSMGNGFTFELESLLFYAIARATAYHLGISGVISVYGDDIICPSSMSAYLTFVLGVFGFEVNSSKSYDTGPFRESCGGHYHTGVDITPFYIRKPVDDIVTLIRTANQLRKWGSQRFHGIIDPDVKPIWDWLRSMIPECLWGGDDLDSSLQLVSLHEPQCRLRPLDSSESTGLGGYYHWLNATWRRASLEVGVHTSVRTLTLENKFRLVNARKVYPRLPSLFYEELGIEDRREIIS